MQIRYPIFIHSTLLVSSITHSLEFLKHIEDLTFFSVRVFRFNNLYCSSFTI